MKIDFDFESNFSAIGLALAVGKMDNRTDSIFGIGIIFLFFTLYITLRKAEEE